MYAKTLIAISTVIVLGAASAAVAKDNARTRGYSGHHAAHHQAPAGAFAAVGYQFGWATGSAVRSRLGPPGSAYQDQRLSEENGYAPR